MSPVVLSELSLFELHVLWWLYVIILSKNSQEFAFYDLRQKQNKTKQNK